MNWLDRTWNFDLATGTYSKQLDRLECTPADLACLLENASSEVLLAKPLGKWSVHEHTGHLLTMESLWIARLDDFVMEREFLRPWNGHNEDTDAADFNRHRLGKLMEDFTQIRLAQVKMLRTLASVAETITARHDRLDRTMRLVDHVYFIAEHDAHHLAAIRLLLETAHYE
jgi:uncharacterized damage-inducible protein DinB